MDPSQRSTVRYAVAGLFGVAILLLIGWLVLREPAPAADESVRVAAVAPRARAVAPLVTPDEDVPHETLTNQVAESTTTNAAALYQQAFAIYDALSKEEKYLITGGSTNVDAAVAAELCGKIQPICDLMHQAAALSNCDWGVEQPITSDTEFPYLNPCRHIARAAVWNVAHCRTNDPAAAVDDLVATMRLGQNMSSPATLIGHLVDLAIQGLVVYSVAGNASTLAGADDTRLVELLNDANYDEQLRHAIEQEADRLARRADWLAVAPPDEVGRWQAGLETLAVDPSRFQSMKPAQVIADLRQAAELAGQYAKALELPEAEYHAWLISRDEAGKTNPFVELLVTPLEQSVSKTQYMTVSSAMAVAGLAVARDGPDALQSHPDPSTGQPFTYTQTGDGFTLESSFQFPGIPGKSSKLSFK